MKENVEKRKKLLGKIWKSKTMSIVLRLIPSVILLQTLFFKFSGSAESRELFTMLGMEPWGRIGVGVLELVTVAMLWLPATIFYGAWLIVLTMVGAIFSHVAILGIAVQGDGGLLFILALIILACAWAVTVLHPKRASIGQKSQAKPKP